MRLQSIVFTLSEESHTKELYIVEDSNVLILDYNHTQILPKGILDTGTYFNSFSVQKWKEYTRIEKLKLNGILSGNFIFEVYERYLLNGSVQEQCIYNKEFSLLQEESVCLEILPQRNDSMCFVRIKAITETIVKDMHFYSDCLVHEEVNLAVVICTFRREVYIERNIEQITERIIDNNNSILHNHMDIIIVDNGQTLNLNSKKCRVIKNRNTGGTGGFTRGILEVLRQKEKKNYTHILLMDDDVDIEPESIERMYSMLCQLNDNYKKSFIGGSMLRLDETCVQEEAGATWDGILHPQGKGYDLRNSRNILLNDQIYLVDYNAWWFCCMPISEIGFDNLPLPFFIHCDDMEYGLRNAKSWILLNGICVWHEIGSARKNIVRDYYDVRNFMVLNILYNKKGYSRWRLTIALIRRLMAGLFLPKLSFPMRINAMKDFFGGIDWWEKQEIDILHQRVSSDKDKTNVIDVLSVCLTVLFLPIIYGRLYKEYHNKWRSLTTEKYWERYRMPPSREKKGKNDETNNGSF